MDNQTKHFESLYPEASRDKELSEIVSFIREGNSVQLIGLPGAGRTNILGLLAYNKQIRLKHFPKAHDYIHFVHIDFSEARNRELVDVVKLLFLSLADSLRERGMQEEYVFINDILKDALSYQDELVLTQGLKRAVDYLSIDKKLTIIFLFDRFEEYLPHLTPQFFTNLRLLRNRAKYRFSVVFSLLRPLEEAVDAMILSDFYEFIAGHYVYVQLNDEASIDFRKTYLEKMTGKTIGKKEEQQVLSLTGGHSKLSRLAFEALLTDRTIDNGQLTIDRLGEYLLEQLTIRNALLEIWKALTPSEQEYLENISTDGDHTAESTYLRKVGLLKGDTVQMPLLVSYMKGSKRIETSENAPILYDEATNIIKKGELILSDNLTKSEFRLLRHLVTHPDTIVDRDEVISVVWKENASTAGVTDQAVDQLIFRVRRKIEDDPNNPQHLHTVKGRGVRFVP